VVSPNLIIVHFGSRSKVAQQQQHSILKATIKVRSDHFAKSRKFLAKLLQVYNDWRAFFTARPIARSSLYLIDFFRFLSILADSCQFLQILVNSCRFLSILAYSCQFLQILVNSCIFLSILADSCQFLQILVNS
jgi:hypothetical protein